MKMPQLGALHRPRRAVGLLAGLILVASVAGLALAGINNETITGSVTVTAGGTANYTVTFNNTNNHYYQVTATVATNPAGVTVNPSLCTHFANDGNGRTISFTISTVAGTTPGGTYAVTATLRQYANNDNDCNGAVSSTANLGSQLVVNKATPAFTFSAIAARTYGDAAFSVAANATKPASDTGAITFALGTGSVGCTVTGAGVVTITGVATGANFCVINASLAADARYNAAGPLSQSFHINLATPAFTFNLSTLPAKTFGDAAFSVAGYTTKTAGDNGAITFALGAGSVGCTVNAAGNVTITGAATGGSFCVISASLAANGNYAAAGPITQSFHINKANPLVSGDAIANRTYGDAPFSVAGFVHKPAGDGGAITFALNAASVGCTVTPAGVVTITGTATGSNSCLLDATVAADANYNAAAVTIGFKINPAAPVFTFSTIAARTYGDAPFSVAANATKPAGDTGAITFALGGGSVGCAVDGAGTVTITGAATGADFCVITASLAADANYLAAGPLSQSFHINQATPTLSFDLSALPAKGYGDSAFSVAGFASKTAGDTGTITFALGAGSVSCAVDAAGNVSITGNGACVIAASLASDGNFVAAGPITQSFDIARATLVVTPDPQSVDYGDAVPTYGFSVTGFAYGQNAGTAAGYAAPTCTSSYAPTTNVAASPLIINCSAGAADNYTFDTTATAQLAIAAAPVVITAPDAGMIFGGTVPSISPSYSGLRNGQTATTTPATCSVNVAPRTTSCTGAADDNYSITYKDGVLTVTPATMFVVPSNQGVSFGDPAPIYTFTLHYGTPGGATVDPSGLTSYTAPVCSSSYTSSTPVTSSPLAITCSGGAADNFVFNDSQTAQLTIGSVAPAFTFDLSSMSTQTYGNGTFSVAGWAHKPAGDTGAVTFSLAAGSQGCAVAADGTLTITGAAVGSEYCMINAWLAADDNFVAAGPAMSQFHIAKAQLDVTPDAKSVTAGDPVPSYTYHITGWLFGQSELTAAGYVKATCDSPYTTSTAAPAALTITCSGASAANYDFTYHTATLTVTAAAATPVPTPVATPVATPTPTPTPAGATPTPTPTPGAATPTPTPTPTEQVGGVTASPTHAPTLPVTSTNNSAPSNGGSTPLFALLICLAFGGLGLLVVQTQRRSLRN